MAVADVVRQINECGFHERTKADGEDKKKKNHEKFRKQNFNFSTEFGKNFNLSLVRSVKDPPIPVPPWFSNLPIIRNFRISELYVIM